MKQYNFISNKSTSRGVTIMHGDIQYCFNLSNFYNQMIPPIYAACINDNLELFKLLTCQMTCTGY